MISAARRSTVGLFVVAFAAMLSLTGAASAGGNGGGQRDREAPSVPTELRVAAATASTVTVAWTPSTDNVGVTGYSIYVDGRRVSDGRREADPTPSFLVSNLSCGQTITFTVLAFDEAHNRSEKATMTVSSAPCADTPPATPAGFRQVATSDDAVVLAWNPSADNVGVVGYGVYRNLQRVASPSDPTVPLAGLACGSSYDYAIDAVDAAGNRSSLAKAYVQTSACASSPAPRSCAVAGHAGALDAERARRLEHHPERAHPELEPLHRQRPGHRLRPVPRRNEGGLADLAGREPVGLACGTSYTFALEALDAAGNRSARALLTTSTSACSTTTPPPAPRPTRRRPRRRAGSPPRTSPRARSP